MANEGVGYAFFTFPTRQLPDGRWEAALDPAATCEEQVEEERREIAEAAGRLLKGFGDTASEAEESMWAEFDRSLNQMSDADALAHILSRPTRELDESCLRMVEDHRASGADSLPS